MARVLVFNAGSSSIKYGVFDTDKNLELLKGQMDRVTDVTLSISALPQQLVASGFTEFDAIGHRVAHGGDAFREATLTDDTVLQVIDSLTPLAPQHNPPGLAGIRAAMAAWPAVPQVAVFDTAFHHTMPPRATTYAIPRRWREAGVRRYGFHGTSHKYVMLRVAEAMQTPPEQLRIISCHLGNGASVCAIERGVSVDTTMGMTPLEGLVMGTRSGDVDPGLFTHLERTMGLSAGMIEDALYHESGLLALSEVSNDMRDIETLAAQGNTAAQLAISVYAYRVRKYIGAYAAAMGGVDAIAFTGGIGENSAAMRKRICERLDFLGVAFDDDKNIAVNLKDFSIAEVHEGHSRVKLMVMETQEKWMIAREAASCLANHQALDATLPIPIAVSARHVHLSQAAVELLFGKGYQLSILNHLSQPGYWAAKETVTVVGPRGQLENVRILGPCRDAVQVEVSRTEAYHLGVDAPLRLSGDLAGTPTITLRGPAGLLRTNGIIVAKRHIHTNPADAARMGLQHGDSVDIEVKDSARDLVFRDTIIRISDHAITEMHIDTDEANAAEIRRSGEGVLLLTDTCATLAHLRVKMFDPAMQMAVRRSA